LGNIIIGSSRGSGSRDALQFFAISIRLRTFLAVRETLVHVCLFAGFLGDLEGALVFFGFSAALDEALVVKFYAL